MVSVKDCIDLHLHIGPEFVRRRYNILSLSRELKKNRMGAVIKNHCISTTALASLARKIDGVQVYGSVVLNYYVGGINKYAILGAMSTNKTIQETDRLDDSRFVVWMPTVHAEAHLKHIKWDFDPLWGVDKRYCQSSKAVRGITILNKGKLIPEVQDVLETIKEYDLVLATGHLSKKETIRLVEAAHDMKIKRVVVTHPVYPPTDLNLDEQKYVSKLGAYIEHTYGVHLIDKIPLSKYVESIREVGSGRTVLSTDLGQVGNPTVTKGFALFASQLMKLGISGREMHVMCSRNPKKLLT